MEFPCQLNAFLVLILIPYAVHKVDSLNYANAEFANGMFKLQWAYNNNKLIFNMTCKTAGWCAVGFTESADGKRMVNYDMAVGGVASNTPYLDGYQSSTIGTPARDPTPDYSLIKATENNGYTNVQFKREVTTAADNKDVQFTVNTEVWIVWAWRNNDDASSGLNLTLKHRHTGVSPKKHNLIMEARSAGMQPPTKNTASHVGSFVVTYVILVLSIYALSF